MLREERCRKEEAAANIASKEGRGGEGKEMMAVWRLRQRGRREEVSEVGFGLLTFLGGRFCELERRRERRRRSLSYAKAES